MRATGPDHDDMVERLSIGHARPAQGGAAVCPRRGANTMMGSVLGGGPTDDETPGGSMGAAGRLRGIVPRGSTGSCTRCSGGSARGRGAARRALLRVQRRGPPRAGRGARDRSTGLRRPRQLRRPGVCVVARARAARRRPHRGEHGARARRGFGFRVDDPVPYPVYAASRRWQRAQRKQVLRFTHVVLEAGRPLFPRLGAGTAAAEVAELRAHGLRVAMLFHGATSGPRTATRRRAGGPRSTRTVGRRSRGSARSPR